MNNTALTTKEAAARLRVSVGRVRQLVLSGELPAEKFGRDLMIKAEDLQGVTVYGKPGRPKKAAVNGAPSSAPAQVTGTGAAEQPAATAPTDAGVKAKNATKAKAGENAAQAKAKAAGKGKARGKRKV